MAVRSDTTSVWAGGWSGGWGDVSVASRRDPAARRDRRQAFNLRALKAAEADGVDVGGLSIIGDAHPEGGSRAVVSRRGGDPEEDAAEARPEWIRERRAAPRCAQDTRAITYRGRVVRPCASSPTGSSLTLPGREIDTILVRLREAGARDGLSLRRPFLRGTARIRTGGGHGESPVRSRAAIVGPLGHEETQRYRAEPQAVAEPRGAVRASESAQGSCDGAAVSNPRSVLNVRMVHKRGARRAKSRTSPSSDGEIMSTARDSCAAESPSSSATLRRHGATLRTY